MVECVVHKGRYRKAIRDLEAEVHHLRNLPLAVGDLQDDLDVFSDAPTKGG